jgi:hypothetical protein
MLPFTTTTVTIENLADGSTPYEGNQYESAFSVDGVVSNLSGSARYIGGNGQAVTAVLHVDSPTEFGLGARITDQSTGARYTVVDRVERYEFGADYIRAGLQHYDGRGR